jgi:hypothetical protein
MPITRNCVSARFDSCPFSEMRLDILEFETYFRMDSGAEKEIIRKASTYLDKISK